MPAVLIELFGLESLGTTLGVFFTATGIAALLGPTLAGIAVAESGGYGGGVVFALTTGLLGFIAILPVRSIRLARAEAIDTDRMPVSAEFWCVAVIADKTRSSRATALLAFGLMTNCVPMATFAAVLPEISMAWH